MFKICSIGCGEFAVATHGPSVRQYADRHPDIVLSGCCDIDPAKAEAYQKQFGYLRSYNDYRRMLDAERPDAVCLVVSVSQTAALAADILRMGYPLLMEKPPGRNREETLQIIEAAKYGTPNHVAFNRRHTPLIRELKNRMTAAGGPETIQNIRYDFFRINRRDEDFSTTAIHGIDTAKFLAGSDFKRVDFSYQEMPELGKNVANIYLFCRFVSGATAQLSFCPNTGVSVERATVNTLDNTWFLNTPMFNEYDAPGRLTQLQNGKTLVDLSGDILLPDAKMFEMSGFYAENAFFFDHIQNKEPLEDDITTALQSVEVADCIRNRKTSIVF